MNTTMSGAADTICDLVQPSIPFSRHYFQCFLGDKYGSRLLPHYIEAKEFKLLRRIAMRRGYDITVMDEWFQRDDNAEPAVYRLRSIDEILTHYEDDEQQDLQKKVRITFRGGDGGGVKFGYYAGN